MFTTPTVAELGTSKKQLLELMNAKQLNSIPIIDNGTVIGLETIHDVTQKEKYDNPVFLMAGGFGTRLKPLTNNCPKPMLKVGDKPILETVINSFKKFGFINFYISTHYLPEVIQNHFGDGSEFGIKITYVHEETPLGTGGALGLLPDSTPDLPLIMINGDVLTNVNFERLLSFHNENGPAATMCVREYDYTVPYGVIKGHENKVLSMVEKPTYSFFVNAGIYVVSNKLLKKVKENTHIDMPTLLENEIEINNSVLMFPVHEYWLDIGRLDDFKKAQTDIKLYDFKQG
jgi:NDP-sugar pyrophosphorylase family protein